MTTHVISDTVTSVVTASLGTSGRRPTMGANATMTRVSSGKIVNQVSRAILYGGGGGRPGCVGRVNQVSSPVRQSVPDRYWADDVWLGALHPRSVLVGVQPGTEVGHESKR
jgi:hypothetical protein